MTMPFLLTFVDNVRYTVSHHEVDGGVGSGVDLHQGASRLPGAKHEAHVPGNSHGDVHLAPGDQSLAVEELRRRHHWTREGKEEIGFLFKHFKDNYVPHSY